MLKHAQCYQNKLMFQVHFKILILIARYGATEKNVCFTYIKCINMSLIDFRYDICVF